jgi:macrolide transport system ATP-binding/permease protein
MAYISVRNLKKVYRPQTTDHDQFEVRALDGVNLDIERGDYVAVMGPSGSGKSTLMQILGLLDQKSSGDYFLDGQDISVLNDDQVAKLRSQKIGFIFQFFNLLARTTATDNVALPMLYSGIKDSTNLAQNLLKAVGLGSRLYHRPHQLSGGQQQRVAIARALANKPELIFADEPTGNISSQQANEILNLLEEMNEKGTTIILVTHETSVAERARRLITVKDGVVVSDIRKRALPKFESTSSTTANHVEETSKVKIYFERLKENLKMALVALSLNKLRTGLATLGVIIGISSVVTMMAVGQGAQEAIQEQLTSLGTNLLAIRPVNPRSNKTVGNFKKFSIEDFELLKEKTKSPESLIKYVDAQAYGNVQASYLSSSASTDLVAASYQNEMVEKNTPLVGRFFTEEEDKERKRVALIGQTLLKNLYPPGANPVGSTIKINRIDFTVIGVLPAKGSTGFKDRDDMILVPLNTGLTRVLGRRSPQSLLAEATSTEDIDIAIKDLEDFFRNRRKLKEDEPNDFEIRNLNEIKEIFTRTTGIISSMLASIAAVSLLVGGIGIMNVMLVAVKERTREVGLRKALGARRKDILVQFLIESVLIGLLGGLI